jgi:hypothetical protein
VQRGEELECGIDNKHMVLGRGNQAVKQGVCGERNMLAGQVSQAETEPHLHSLQGGKQEQDWGSQPTCHW